MPYQCFIILNPLTQHNDVVHRVSTPGDVFGRCEICLAPFGGERELRRHMHDIHCDVPFNGSHKCQKCNKYFYLQSLKAHYAKCSGKSSSNPPSPMPDLLPVPDGNFEKKSDVMDYMKYFKDKGEKTFKARLTFFHLF